MLANQILQGMGVRSFIENENRYGISQIKRVIKGKSDKKLVEANES